MQSALLHKTFILSNVSCLTDRRSCRTLVSVSHTDMAYDSWYNFHGKTRGKTNDNQNDNIRSSTGPEYER